MLAPLAVADQTVGEALAPLRWRNVTHAREEFRDPPRHQHHRIMTAFINSTLSDSRALSLMNPASVKHHNAKTLQNLLDAFRNTPYKLAGTATPAPNDWTELGNHAEFLGVRSSALEMLARTFVHDAAETQVWRLKGCAARILAVGFLIGRDDSGRPRTSATMRACMRCPPLNVLQHTVETDHIAAHGLLQWKRRP